MNRYSLEFSVGLFVLAGLLCLGYLTVKLGKMEVFSSDGYQVTANFTSVAGLRPGARVEIAGVAVGKVAGISLLERQSRYYAQVTLHLNRGILLSEDSIASIKTSGLIGDKYVNLSLGGSSSPVDPGGEIVETESAVDIEALIGKFAFGGLK
ncbi:MAG: outer membrane lipid asymmetry maintenance protein MlaD [Desulfovibrio sp.]|jgi:phospholipid/cholesterol/gamma-HCH transport system substrate-binding protein|nr:outer membrane lipid asymmetry maintenance protein MlaD [Desulfovibrio sp.]